MTNFLDPAISEIDIELDIEVKRGLNNSNESSWSARHARIRKERNAVAEAFEHIPKPFGWSRYFVLLIRNGPRRLDDDNLRGAFKAFRDQIAQWIGLDDASEFITWDYAQRITKVKTIDGKRFRSYPRIRIAPVPIDLAQDESLARLKAPRLEPTELDNLKQPRFVQKPRAIPELAGGKPERVIELHPRNNGVSSRMRVRLMKCTRDEGIGKGVLYVHLSLFWTDTRKQAWRSQGISVRQEEIRDLIKALTSMADGLGLPDTPRGVIFAGDEMGPGADTPSNNAKTTEHPFPIPPDINSDYFPAPPPENNSIISPALPPDPRYCRIFSPEYFRAVAALENERISAPEPAPDYTREVTRKRKPGAPRFVDPTPAPQAVPTWDPALEDVDQDE